MESLAKILTSTLVKWNIVKDENKELYVYGFWQGFVFIINFTSVVIIGSLFNVIWQSLVFMIAYGLLRPITGGYHARTQKGCFILSILLIIAVLSVIRWLPWNNLIRLMVLVVSTSIVYLLAPVEDRNKPLDELEQQVYRKRSRIIVILLFSFIYICSNRPEKGQITRKFFSFN